MRGVLSSSVVRDVGSVCEFVLPIEEYRRHFRGVLDVITITLKENNSEEQHHQNHHLFV